MRVALKLLTFLFSVSALFFLRKGMKAMVLKTTHGHAVSGPGLATADDSEASDRSDEHDRERNVGLY